MKKIIYILVLFAVNGYCDDNLKNFLVDKGFIDKKEYEEYVKDKNNNNNMEINGVLTLRYYYLHNKFYQIARERFFLQLKTEFSKKLEDNFKVNFGFATGDKNKPRSNFEMIEDGFLNKNLNLSIANFSFQRNGFKVMLGKFKNNIWQTNSAMFDTDINFEGIATELDKKGFSLKADILFLSEFSYSKKDPKAYFFQLTNSNKYFKAGVSYFDFVYIKGVSTSTFISRPSSPYPLSNSSLNSKYKYDYDIISYDIKSDIKIAKNLFVSPFLNYGFNTSLSEKNKFYVYGGEAYLEGKDYKKFSLGFNYRKIENDSFLDIFPDVAAYGGATGMKSYRFVGCYSLNKNISFVPYYIYSKPLNKLYKKEKAVIFDINAKF